VADFSATLCHACLGSGMTDYLTENTPSGWVATFLFCFCPDGLALKEKLNGPDIDAPGLRR